MNEREPGTDVPPETILPISPAGGPGQDDPSDPPSARAGSAADAPEEDPAARRRKWRLVGLIALPVVLLDQITKYAAVAFFDGIEGRSRTVVPGFFDLVYARNPGAAFSMGRDLEPPALRIAFFVTVSALGALLVSWLVHRTPADRRVFILGLAFVLAGTIGNLIDRAVAGTVIDFLEFYTRADWMVDLLGCHPRHGCRFPAFNIADSSITVGVGFLLADAVIPEPRRGVRGE